jgi:hypothetical protein
LLRRRCTRCSPRRASPWESASSASSATSPATRKSGTDLDSSTRPPALLFPEQASPLAWCLL